MPALALLALLAVVPSPQERPFARAVIADEPVAREDFERGAGGWHAAHDAEVGTRDGALLVTTLGSDPYLRGPEVRATGDFVVRLRARFDVGGEGQVFFTTRSEPHEAERRSARFAFPRGEWATLECPLGEVEELTRLRLDPGAGRGEVAIDWIELRRRVLHPLAIEGLRQDEHGVVASVRNHGDRPVGGIAPGTVAERAFHAETDGPFAAADVRVGAGDLPPLAHRAYVLTDEGGDGLPAIGDGDVRVAIHPDGRGALVSLEGTRGAALFPLVSRDGRAVTFPRIETAGASAVLTADGVVVELRVADGEVHVKVRAEREVEGPVLRTVAPQERALFAGLEFLAAGEASSSNADIETDARWRFAPDPALVTLPLIASEQGGHVVALIWRGRRTRPTFLTPNRLDGDDGVRASLRGAAIDARVLVRAGTIEDAIDVVARGLPEVPEAPLPRAGWAELCRGSLAGPLAGAGGFGHCAEARWPRQPFADHLSAWFRLTGEVHALAGPGKPVVPGGAHQRDDTIWLVTGRAAKWLEVRGDEAARLRRDQREDGSFRYDGPYRRGHYEDTSSGHCLLRAATLLDHARLTGDPASRDAGLRALAFAARFRTPRGAQTWELSLHTPDVMAAAHGVRAHVLAFELTGDRAFLERARTWARRGLPFVYLWDDDDAYATIAVYGATNWRAPLWLGLPVQWCGVVYAQALAELARHDDDPRWRQVALGILRRAQHMQYPDGPLAGCLPDVFVLDGGIRAGPSINPCALLFLDATLAGLPAGLSLAVAPDGTRVVAPFPVRVEGGVAVVSAHDGVRYQVVVDGDRVLDVGSRGEDRVPLGR